MEHQFMDVYQLCSFVLMPLITNMTPPLPTGPMLLRFPFMGAYLPTCPPTPCTCQCRCCGGNRCTLVTTTCNSKCKNCPAIIMPVTVCPATYLLDYIYLLWLLRVLICLFVYFVSILSPYSPSFYLHFLSQAAVAASQPPSTSPPSSPTPSPHQPAQPNAVQPPLGPNAAPNALPENQPPNPIQMNAQGGAVLNDDEMNRDWLDWLYTLSRVGVLLSIVYFYSSFSRFVMVVGAMLLVYLWVNSAEVVKTKNV